MSIIKNEELVVSASTSPAKVRDFERVFRHFDKDGDDKISPAELRCCMESVGEAISPEEAAAAAAVESLDSDGDGFLSFEDFLRLMEGGGEEEEEKKKDLRKAFAMYEMDGLGCITPTSLSKMLGRLGESKSIEECTVMIRRFDLNGDGVLSLEEFSVMMH